MVDLEGMINLKISATAQGCDTELMARAARLMNMNERAKEEVEIVKQDMIRTATFYSQEHSLLTSYVEKLKCKPSTVYTRGCLNLLFHRLILCEFTLADCTKAFSPSFLTHTQQVSPYHTSTLFKVTMEPPLHFMMKTWFLVQYNPRVSQIAQTLTLTLMTDLFFTMILCNMFIGLLSLAFTVINI